MVNNVDWKCLELKTKLGYGSFSDVYMAIWTDKIGNRKKIAAKIFRDTNSEKYDVREIKHLSEVNHKNIVTFYGTSKNSEARIALLLEYADCGTLYDCLYNQNQNGRVYSYEYSDSLRWMHQLAKAMDYLHLRNIIHRDLKPQNLLLFENFQTLKIADFGTVTELMTKSTENIGTGAYMAPEVSSGEKYNCASDVYSFGIIFWEVLARKKPFSHLPNPEALIIKYAAVEGKRPLLEELKFNDDDNRKRFQSVKQLLEKCWDGDSRNRPRMDEVVSCFVLESTTDNLDISPLIANSQLIAEKRYAQYAPPQSQWFHGFLDDDEAYARLRESAIKGSYLVFQTKQYQYQLIYYNRRICDKIIEVNNGSYSLNYSKNTEHKFRSLNDLVGYYTIDGIYYNHDQLKIPVPPPEPVLYMTKVIAILNYNEKTYVEELNFEKGDIFTIHNEIYENWLWVTAIRSGKQGMICSKCVTYLDGTVDVNTMYSWFHPQCTEEDAIDLLQSANSGDFLVRPSEKNPNDYLLCIRNGPIGISELRIKNKDNIIYVIGNRTFDNLQLLIDFYREEAIIEGNPVCKSMESYFELTFEDSSSTFDELSTALADLRLKLSEDIMHEGGLDLWTPKTESWMNFHVKLNLNSCVYIYKTMQHIKRVAVIDSSFSSIYMCPESLCRPYSFQIITWYNRIINIRASTRAHFEEWINLLQHKGTLRNTMITRTSIRDRCAKILYKLPKIPISFNFDSDDDSDESDEPICHIGFNLWNTATHSWTRVIMKSRKTLLGYILKIRNENGEQIDMINLSRAKYYQCHKSLWNRQYCFQIYESNGKVSYLSASNREDYEAWISVMEHKCAYKLRHMNVYQNEPDL